MVVQAIDFLKEFRQMTEHTQDSDCIDCGFVVLN